LITAAAAAALLISTMAFAVGGGGQGEGEDNQQQMHPAHAMRPLAAGQPDELAGSPRDVTEGGPQNTAAGTANRDRDARAQRRSNETGN
jgi:hypothetical protein